MKWDRLVRVAAPAVSPLSLADAKAHLKVDSDAFNGEIQAAIDAAVAQIDGPRGIGVALVQQTWRLSLDSFYPAEAGRDCEPFFWGTGIRAAIRIPLGPVLSVDQVQYVDGAGATQTLAPSAYQADLDHDPARLVPAYAQCWPIARWQPGAVKVTFKAGFGPAAGGVPANLVAALKLMVGDLFANRETVTVGERAAMVVNPTVERLLASYRILF